MPTDDDGWTTWSSPSPGALPPPAPPPLVEPPRHRREFLGMTAKTWVIVSVCVIPVAAFAVIGGLADDKPAGRDCEVVTYALQTRGNVNMDVTMRNASGDTEQFVASDGWTANLGCLPTGQFAYISAQLNGAGSVECTIGRDGARVAHAQSSGEFVIASCSD